MAFEVHPWKVIEHGLDPKAVRLSESLTSTGNGYMGMRGNFEEDFSGDTHIGTYIGGVWFPDKTRVGWWKNGYPQYFGKTINAVRLMGIHAGRVPGAHREERAFAQCIQDLKTRMDQAVCAENFEQAAALRDEIRSLIDKQNAEVKPQ